MKRNHMILGGILVAVLIGLSAGAGAYLLVKNNDQPEPIKVAATQNNNPPPQQVAQSECDDANVVGAAIGAVAGGLAGNQIGSGRGQDLATVGGAIGGGYLGQQHIPTRNVLCP
jgi:uncharacterized protein YcfJ